MPETKIVDLLFNKLLSFSVIPADLCQGSGFTCECLGLDPGAWNQLAQARSNRGSILMLAPEACLIRAMASPPTPIKPPFLRACVDLAHPNTFTVNPRWPRSEGTVTLNWAIS